MNNLFYIILPIIIAFLINVTMYNKSSNMISDVDIKYLPPGYIIGVVWIILLGLMGYILYLLIYEFKLKSLRNSLFNNFNY